MKSLSIVGCGNLGVSLVNGLLESKTVEPKQFHLSRRNISALASLKDRGCNVYAENNACVSQSDVIVIGVLPQKINAVLEEIQGSIDDSKLIVSLVSSVTIAEIKEVLGENTRVVRAMPNTAIAIRESMTCISGTSQNDIDFVNGLFKNVGETMVINEEQMTSATALCACGIAFFLRAIRAASQGGNQIDFHASEALKMAAQTAKGAASLLLHNNTHPEEEIDKVTSPKGCTIAGLNEMEHEGFSSAFIKGIVLSAERAKGLY
jgi:pyrroline-5-carboxylate reductase